MSGYDRNGIAQALYDVQYDRHRMVDWSESSGSGRNHWLRYADAVIAVLPPLPEGSDPELDYPYQMLPDCVCDRCIHARRSGSGVS